MTLDVQQIRTAALAHRIKWHYHALQRAGERGITRVQAIRVLQEGEIIEQRPGAKPYPKCLMMAMVETDRPLYVSVAHDRTRDHLHVITVHWYDPRIWEDPWTRKSKKPKLREKP